MHLRVLARRCSLTATSINTDWSAGNAPTTHECRRGYMLRVALLGESGGRLALGADQLGDRVGGGVQRD